MNLDGIKKVTLNGKQYKYEHWMKGMTKDEINYMLKARYVTAFFKWHPDL